MSNSVKITLIITSSIIILALIGMFMFYNLIPSELKGKTINVQGNSQIQVSPDLVTIYFNVETNGSTTKIANDANSKITDDLITALVKLGFNRADIQTENFNIYEDIRWEDNTQKSYGYKASHQIKLEMNTSQTNRIGDVIDAGINSGALLQWINFELSTEKQNFYKAQALKEAGQDAKTKAEAIAEGLGQKLGSLVSISTSDWGYRPWNLYSAGAEKGTADVSQAKLASTNIQPSTQEVTGYVSVVYKIR